MQPLLRQPLRLPTKETPMHALHTALAMAILAANVGVEVLAV
jgi:hypothetical protein